MKFFSCCKKQTESDRPESIEKNPLGLYKIAFQHYKHSHYRHLEQQLYAIENNNWYFHPNTKDIVLTAIRQYFTPYLDFLLLTDEGSPAEYLLRLFSTIIKKLPISWLSKEGIFSELLNLKESISLNFDMPPEKLIVLIEWGMPLSKIEKRTLKSLLLNLTPPSIEKLILTSSKRAAEAEYLKMFILNNHVLKEAVDHCIEHLFFKISTINLIDDLGYNNTATKPPLQRATRYITYQVAPPKQTAATEESSYITPDSGRDTTSYAYFRITAL